MAGRWMAATGACALLALSAPAQAAVTFGSASVNSNALASATGGTNHSGNGNGSGVDASSTFVDSLDASSYGNGTTTTNKFAISSQGQAFEDSAATFASPSSGTIHFSGQVSAFGANANSASQGQDNGEYYNYAFSLDTASNFDLTYAFTETYKTVNNSYILIDDTTNSVVLQFNGNGNMNGSSSALLDAGDYRLGASTEFGDFAFQNGVGTTTGNHDEAYAFNIAAVSAAPEPGVWALMIAGLGLMGVALRLGRRRSGTIFAV